MNNTRSFSQESSLKQKITNEIAEFWQQGTFSSFKGAKKTRINYAYFATSPQQKCLIIVNGRNESYLKYQELSYDLTRQGFQVFLFDHRGQGLSERLLKSEYKGYVESFQDYVNDLNGFIDNVVTPHCQSKPYLLAHSMGGAIAARFMQDYPEKIQASVLSAPMLGFNTGAAPNVIARGLIKALNGFNRLVDDTPWYLISQQDYQVAKFADNELTQSKVRFKIFTELQEENPEIQLGGVTLQWLVEGINAQKAIFSNITALTTPTIVLQAGEDTVIDNASQDYFCQKLHTVHPQSCPTSKPVLIEGARHELFFEKDIYRNETLNTLLDWFELHSH
ncbi:alpha/beta fold hydrolase [Colwellia asteriadis]|uniref:Alpha/beta fold hydrolase n=1 Tax=Colwellia asteriadis TaxID=517723 RepID=A0ABN1L363_9GAMM